jgi:type II secretory pathway pseudopilin PulG
MMKRSPSSNRAAFTIVELLVVAAVFFIMLSALTPFVNMAKDRSRKMRCANNLRQISLGLHSYAADHESAFPASLGELYPNYISNEKAFDCPATKSEGTAKAPEYSYVTGLRESSDPKGAIVADIEGNHGKKAGKNVLRLGGAVEWVD